MARNVVTQVDSADFFVQALDATAAILTAPVTSTASRYVSSDIANRLHRSTTLYWTITSLSVGVSLAVNVNGKDAVTGNYMPIARVSLDASSLTTGTAGGAQNYAIQVIPGGTANNSPAAPAAGAPVAPLQAAAILPAVFQVVVSAQTAPGTFSFQMGMSRSL